VLVHRPWACCRALGRIEWGANIGALISECSPPVERGRGNAEQIGGGLRIQQVWESGDRFFTD
jgi:hypothetical protein